ncbi:hypothetical protein N665_0170s0057 [Sinapis alba]|nr:hypothetical protein N665_0170s0057 [Sinapis alba]
MQRTPHSQHTETSSCSNTPVYPPCSRFLPTDLGCVRVHLKNKVDKNKSGFITTLDLYENDPWLLDHVHNDLFPRGEWYYFTPRNKRGVSSSKRSVRGSEGGTWKSITTKEPICDKDKKVQGYMQNLVYNKTNANGDIKPTGWSMVEYCLHNKDIHDDLVLCHIKKKGFAEEVTNNILPNLVQDHEEEAGANGVEIRTTLQEDHQRQQQQDQEARVVYIPHEGQDSGFERMMNNENNFMVTTMMLQEDHGDATQQQQQQEQDAPPVLVPPPPPHEGQDAVLEEMMNNENNFMTSWDEDQQFQQWDDSDLYFDVDELLSGITKDDVNEGHLQQPVSQAPDAVGSADKVTFTSD